ncbi:MAG TPA: hypothetical protein PLX06_14935, partial [Fimbriimonadaceae bacterium]|nr:hypothetical protein [Fimbriimonadaceae bacterium]
RIDRTSRPRLKKEEVVLAFLVRSESPWLFGQDPDPEDPLRVSLREHLESGGRALFLNVRSKFPEASRHAYENRHAVSLESSKSDQPDFHISSGGESEGLHWEDPLVRDEPGFGLAYDESGFDIARLTNLQTGMVLSIDDAIGMTNRFIDRDDNAAFALWAVGMMSPEKGPIVILESMHSAAVDPGLLALLGPWAAGAWWQMVLCFLVIAYTLGRRFGIPEVDRVQQRGGRELVDATADVMLRANMGRVALKRIVQAADRDIRKQFGIAADLPPKRRNELIDPELAACLSRAEFAVESTLSDYSAARLAQELEDRMAILKGKEPRNRRRRKRR